MRASDPKKKGGINLHPCTFFESADSLMQATGSLGGSWKAPASTLLTERDRTAALLGSSMRTWGAPCDRHHGRLHQHFISNNGRLQQAVLSTWEGESSTLQRLNNLLRVLMTVTVSAGDLQ